MRAFPSRVQRPNCGIDQGQEFVIAGYEACRRGDIFTARMSVTIGSRRGPYEIVSTLGMGGMGEVYRARDNRVRRDVALKMIRPESRARFEAEARAVAELNHPDVVTLYDVDPRSRADTASAPASVLPESLLTRSQPRS